MRALIISPWFGRQPPWYRRYVNNVKRQTAFDWYFPTDIREFRKRVRRTLGIDAVIEPNTGKIHDYRPAFGEIFAKEIRGYDWWGHTDLDCVYGRLEVFYNETVLQDVDVFSDSNVIGGPWVLFRKRPETISFFREVDGWKDFMLDPTPSGWIEFDYTWLIRRSGLSVITEIQHGYNDAFFLRRNGRMLTHFRKEIPFYHFRFTKKWPKIERASQS